jgi:lantibiotic modifying enzyme
VSGAIPILLLLADRTGESRWLDLAGEFGRRLVEAALIGPEGTAGWSSPLWPEPLGGFAHGGTSVGWALALLSLASGEPRFSTVAEAAFRYDEILYDPVRNAWSDIRRPGEPATGWCHGAVGIGLVAADLRRRAWDQASYDPDEIIRRAAMSTWTHGLGWNHTLCHGDLGAWELLANAIEAGLGPDGLRRGHCGRIHDRHS